MAGIYQIHMSGTTMAGKVNTFNTLEEAYKAAIRYANAYPVFVTSVLLKANGKWGTVKDEGTVYKTDYAKKMTGTASELIKGRNHYVLNPDGTIGRAWKPSRRN